MRKVHVKLGSASYDVLIESGLVNKAGRIIESEFKPSSVHIITDGNLSRLHLSKLRSSFKRSPHCYRVPPGESSKSVHQFTRLSREILSENIDRRALILAFGGGVVGDLAGFVAASLLRGVSYVQMPTSLLAQVDSSVGGKTGLNLPEGKNLIGAFHQPKMVLIDPSLLLTLPKRHLSSAYSEILKISLVRDSKFFHWLERNGHKVLGGDLDATTQAITSSVKLKADIVSKDEKESGPRAILNFGHSFAHAFEVAGSYKSLHGEAVSVGVAYGLALSKKRGLLTKDSYERVMEHFKKLNLPSRIEDLSLGSIPNRRILELMKKDKKSLNSSFRLVLLHRIGAAQYNVRLSESKLLHFLVDQKS